MAISLNNLIPLRSDTFFGEIHTSLVDMTYHRLFNLAYKSRLYVRFEKLTKEIDFKQMEERLLKLKNEIPERLTIYDIEMYKMEIFSITFGFLEEERVKKLVRDITEHASVEDLIDINVERWSVLKNRIGLLTDEATKFLLDGEYTEEQAYHLITYIQGLTIMNNIINRYEEILLRRSDDFSKDLDVIVRFLLLSLITAKYIDGETQPEEYIYNMEYVSEIFVRDEEDAGANKDAGYLISLLAER